MSLFNEVREMMEKSKERFYNHIRPSYRVNKTWLIVQESIPLHLLGIGERLFELAEEIELDEKFFADCEEF